jgi:hypothetical protein
MHQLRKFDRDFFGAGLDSGAKISHTIYLVQPRCNTLC